MTTLELPWREGGDGFPVMFFEGVVGELKALLGSVGPQVPGQEDVHDDAPAPAPAPAPPPVHRAMHRLPAVIRPSPPGVVPQSS